jgi:kynureninase
MKPDRRTFLRRATLGAAGLMAAPGLKAGEPPARGALPAYDERAPETFWSAVRDQFPLSRDLIYFNTGGLGPASQPALSKVEETTRKLQARSEHGHGLFAEARGVVARFFGAQPEEIAFVRNASEGNSIVASGLKLDPGDEVIFETHAHPGGSFPWLNQQALRGITVRLFEPDPRDPAGNVTRIAALINSRTRVVQVSHVTAPTGLLMPVAEIAALCRGRGVWFHLDGAQSAGMLPFTMRETGCDSYATSGHKWLGGPLETGVLFVRRDRMNEVAAAHVGASWTACRGSCASPTPRCVSSTARATSRPRSGWRRRSGCRRGSAPCGSRRAFAASPTGCSPAWRGCRAWKSSPLPRRRCAPQW